MAGIRNVNWDAVPDRIAQHYNFVVKGLAKDSIQNSKDARKHLKTWRDFGVEFKLYDRLGNYDNVFSFADYGTTGMNKKMHRAYLGYHFSEKDFAASGGDQGQGKFLFHYFSKDKIVLTETFHEKEGYRFLYSLPGFYWDTENLPCDDDVEWSKKNGLTGLEGLKTIQDFFPEVTPITEGTRVWILNLKLKQEILDYFPDYIGIIFWETITKKDVNFIFKHIGKEKNELKSVIIQPVKYPKPIANEDIHERIRLEGVKGHITNLQLNLAPEKTNLRKFISFGLDKSGLSIQRDMMEITRIDCPNEKFNSRFWGHVTFDHEAELELKKVELGNHDGFKGHTKIWQRIKNQLNNIINDFINKNTTKEEQEDTDIDNSKDIANIISKLVSEHLGNFTSGKKSDIYFAPFGYKGPIRQFYRDKEIDLKIAVNSNLLNDVSVDVVIDVISPSNSQMYKQRYPEFHIRKNSKRKLPLNQLILGKDFPLIERGEWVIQGTIKNPATGEIYNERSSSFYYGEEPPEKNDLPKININPLKLQGGNTKREPNDIVTLCGSLNNETKNIVNTKLEVVMEDSNGNVITSIQASAPSYDIYEIPADSSIDFSYDLDLSLIQDKINRGIYKIIAIVRKGKKEWHQKYTRLYYLVDPRGISWIENVRLARQSELKKMKVLFIEEKTMFFNILNPELKHVRNKKYSSKKMKGKELNDLFVKSALEYAIFEVAKYDFLGNPENYSAENIDRYYPILSNMISDYYDEYY